MTKVKKKSRYTPLGHVKEGEKSCALFSRWLRERRKLSQRGLAEVCGTSNGYIAQVEQRFHPYPVEYMKRLYKICSPEEKRFLLECLYHEMDNYLAF